MCISRSNSFDFFCWLISLLPQFLYIIQFVTLHKKFELVLYSKGRLLVTFFTILFCFFWIGSDETRLFHVIKINRKGAVLFWNTVDMSSASFYICCFTINLIQCSLSLFLVSFPRQNWIKLFFSSFAFFTPTHPVRVWDILLHLNPDLAHRLTSSPNPSYSTS